MTEEQLACIRRFLEDFDRLAEIAADMHWAKTDTKHLSLRIPRGFHGVTDPFWCIAVFRFEQGFVRAHFAEAAAQVLIAAETLYEGWDADGEWQDDEQRRDKFKTWWGVPVWDALEYEKVTLTEDRMDDMIRYICDNEICDGQTQERRRYEMPPEALAMLSDFRDAKLYDIGEARCTGYDGKGWIALKDDAFLWVKYSGISD